MFTHDDPVWSAAAIADQVADATTNYAETFIESFLVSFIDLLSADARQIFWHVVDV